MPTTLTRRRYLPVVVAALVALLVAACSEPMGSKAGSKGASSTTNPRVAACEGAASVVACAPKGSMLGPLMPNEATRAEGRPIRIGTINQDTGAAGAFPELTEATRTAIDFLNEEMDGVDGRPIELVACNTNFSPDLSQSCAQQMVAADVDAVVGGIDIWGTGITTLANNGIPLVGGIPVSFDSVRSPVSFQFSGGTWGAVLGMGKYAVDELHAKKVAIIYAEFGPITDAAELGAKALRRRGVEVTLVPVAAINADMVQALNTAAQADPDVVLALTADAGCKPAMTTAEQIGLRAPIMYTGACAAPAILDAVGDAADGAVFNLEADLDNTSPDNVLYRAIVQKYGPDHHYEWQSAGTVTFRAMVNLYAAMRAIGGDDVSRRTLLRQFRTAKDAPSFFGHPYTCDGEQLRGYPAMCSPQQSLGKLVDGTITPVSGWIDVSRFAG